MRFALATILGVATLAIVLAPASALADGDPASDVLIGENVYYPYSPAVSTSLQRRLNRETAAAARAHFPIKVALIATPADLGAIPTLFGKPQQYAHFLEQEISFLNIKPLLLVVMPNGYGTQHLGRAATQSRASFEKPAQRPERRSRPGGDPGRPQARRRGRASNREPVRLRRRRRRKPASHRRVASARSRRRGGRHRQGTRAQSAANPLTDSSNPVPIVVARSKQLAHKQSQDSRGSRSDASRRRPSP